MPTYSIIIPVYNVEAYLPACLDSVLAQDTTSDYEVILVDDGSTDRSGAICDEYAAKYPHIRVIHQKNAGVSAARNAGLDAAQGEYILFVDSDDLWKPSLLSAMDRVLAEKADMTLFLFESFGDGVTQELFQPAVFPQGESGMDYLQRLFSIHCEPLPSVWTYLYRRAFLLENRLMFEPGLEVAEDYDFNMAALSVAEKVVSVKQALLLYRVRTDSLSHTAPSVPKQKARLRIAAKWYRTFPVTAIANRFAANCLAIPDIPFEDAAELLSLAGENRDIFENVTGWRMRLACLLYRTLGIYRGGRVYMKLIDFKHFLEL